MTTSVSPSFRESLNRVRTFSLYTTLSLFSYSKRKKKRKKIICFYLLLLRKQFTDWSAQTEVVVFYDDAATLRRVGRNTKRIVPIKWDRRDGKSKLEIFLTRRDIFFPRRLLVESCPVGNPFSHWYNSTRLLYFPLSDCRRLLLLLLLSIRLFSPASINKIPPSELWSIHFSFFKIKEKKKQKKNNNKINKKG